MIMKNSLLISRWPIILVLVLVFGSNSIGQPVTVISYQKYSSTSGGLPFSLYNGDRFGHVTSIGDLNGDGITDLAAGAYWRADPYSETGTFWIIFMNADGSVQSSQEIGNNHGGFPNILSGGENFGSIISPIGDINDDGVTDIAVSGHDADFIGSYSGAVYILLMNTNGTVASYYVINGLNTNFTNTLHSGDGFGRGITSLGDFDGDGVEDIAVGSMQDDDGGTDRGCMYLIMLNTDGSVKSYYLISSVSGGLPFTIDDYDLFSYPENIGDVNNDGITDVAVSARYDDDGGSNAGAVYILYLNQNGTVNGYQKISDAPGPNQVDLSAGDGFGACIKSIGDLNGDGYRELIASALADDFTGTDAGAFWILFLGANGTLVGSEKITEGLANCTASIDPYDRLAAELTSIGDFNNDGWDDVAVAADLDDDGGTEMGAFYIFYLTGSQSASFGSSDTAACQKFCIDFYDSSSSSTTSWLWLFDGGTPASSTNENPTNICYQVPGNYDVTLITSNGVTNDTLTLSDYVTVYSTPSFPVISISGYTLTSSPALTYQWQLNSVDIAGATNQSYTITQTGYYTVVITGENGCENSTSVYVIITGIEDPFSTADLSIYPNPSHGIFTVEWVSEEPFEELRVEVTNTLGQLIFSDEEKSNVTQFERVIDLHAYPHGIYFLELSINKSGDETMVSSGKKKLIYME
jgi:PKD repeat protein